jgi:hypothetical protein
MFVKWETGTGPTFFQFFILLLQERFFSKVFTIVFRKLIIQRNSINPKLVEAENRLTVIGYSSLFLVSWVNCHL